MESLGRTIREREPLHPVGVRMAGELGVFDSSAEDFPVYCCTMVQKDLYTLGYMV